MHEYGFAAQMLEEIRKIAKKNKLKNLLAVRIEYADDHADEKTMGQILSDLARGTELGKTKFKLKKIGSEESLFKIREINYK